MIEIEEVLFDERTIDGRVRELAAQISRDYADTEVVLVCILKGAAVFTADLMRRLTMPLTVEFVQAASYGSSTSPSRDIVIKKDLDADITGRHVLLVDTIIDTGETLNLLITRFSARGPASLRAVVLLDKKPRRTVDVPLAYRGFEIPDRFVVGYGMDCDGQLRNLPSIAVIKSSE